MTSKNVALNVCLHELLTVIYTLLLADSNEVIVSFC